MELRSFCLSVWLHSIQLVVGRGLVETSESEERLEGSHRCSPTVEAERELVEVCL